MQKLLRVPMVTRQLRRNQNLFGASSDRWYTDSRRWTTKGHQDCGVQMDQCQQQGWHKNDSVCDQASIGYCGSQNHEKETGLSGYYWAFDCIFFGIKQLKEIPNRIANVCSFNYRIAQRTKKRRIWRSLSKRWVFHLSWVDKKDFHIFGKRGPKVKHYWGLWHYFSVFRSEGLWNWERLKNLKDIQNSRNKSQDHRQRISSIHFAAKHIIQVRKSDNQWRQVYKVFPF